jgi:poly(3-hydroxybutyrate) depolymerase
MTARLAFLVVALATCAAAPAQRTVTLSASACANPGTLLFAHGFDVADTAPSDASGGRGGAYPGNHTRTVVVGGASKSYYLYVPSAYDPARPWPLLVALHGAAGSPANAATYAQAVRADWSGTANANGFVVLAPVASGASGGWNGADYAALDAALADAAGAYNLERTRVYLWGFSAGGHFGHDLALTNPGVFAAYGVHAGTLVAYACDAIGAPPCAYLLGNLARKVPVDIHIGRSDAGIYPYASADAGRFATHGWTTELSYVEFDGAHAYALAHFPEVWSHVCRHAVVP